MGFYSLGKPWKDFCTTAKQSWTLWERRRSKNVPRTNPFPHPEVSEAGHPLQVTRGITPPFTLASSDNLRTESDSTSCPKRVWFLPAMLCSFLGTFRFSLPIVAILTLCESNIPL